MAVLVSDSFNRTNSATTLGSTDSYAGGTSKAWIVETTTTGTPKYGINSNRAYNATNVLDDYCVVDAGVSDNISVQLDFPVYVAGQQRIVWRYVDAQNNFLMQDNQVYIFVNYSATVVCTLSTTLKAGDTVRVELRGNQHTIFINNVQVGQFTDSRYLTATKHGMCAWAAPSARFDNFIISDLAAGGTTIDGAVSLSGSTSLSIDANVLVSGDTGLSTNADLTANGSILLASASTALIANGDLTVNGAILLSGDTILSTDTTLTTDASILINGVTALSVNSILITDGSILLAGSAALSSDSTLSVNTEVLTMIVSLNLSASSDLNTTANIIVSGVSAFGADATLNTISDVLVSGISLMSVDSQLSVNAEVIAIDTSIKLGTMSDMLVNASVLVDGQVNLLSYSNLLISGVSSDLLDQIIDKIQLHGNVDRIVYLQGNRELNVILEGHRELIVLLRGGLMTAIRQNFSMYAGDSKEIVVPVVGVTSLNGSTAKWIMKNNTSQVLKDTISGITLTGTEVHIRLDPIDTSTLSGMYYHEAELTDQLGNVSTIFTGTVIINKSLV